MTQYKTTEHPLYFRWKHIRVRCNNPKDREYKNYGGRGIWVCKRWDSFYNFLEDMGFPDSDDMSVGRIDNDGGYTPTNCRWATDAQQARNRRNNVWLTANGETMVIADWAARLGVKHCIITARLRYGWTVEEACTTPRATKGNWRTHWKEYPPE